MKKHSGHRKTESARMISFFGKLSIKRKLVLIIMLVSSVAMLLATGVSADWPEVVTGLLPTPISSVA